MGYVACPGIDSCQVGTRNLDFTSTFKIASSAVINANLCTEPRRKLIIKMESRVVNTVANRATIIIGYAGFK
jgi:hypothetical protein